MDERTWSPFELTDHTADLLLNARGRDLAELLANAARGLLAAIGQLRTSPELAEVSVALTAADREELFHDFLSEVLFLFENQHFVVESLRFDLLDDCRLDAILSGGMLDRQASVFHREVKAVTYHELAIRRAGGFLEATVVLDI